MNYTATYSPEDNKLRLYASSRLDPATYARVRAAGFIWAPKQDLFVAPAWTPERADLAEELAGEIGDEDTALVDRAEERAERFSDYSESRAGDAHRAREAVAAIADNIPLGQPILVGHHSERHARKDAERIQNGMRRAVKMWETSRYWTERAAGAIRHAKYKERPDVRARRIKTLEAEARKVARSKEKGETGLRLWRMVAAEQDAGKARKLADHVSGADHVSHCFTLAEYPRAEGASKYEGSMGLWSALGGGGRDVPIITPQQAAALAIAAYERSIAWATRWLNHLENRLAYERAMLNETGGTVADKVGPEVGGGCRCWATAHRIAGAWSYIKKVNKVSVTVLDNWGNGGGFFTRTIPFDKLTKIMSAAEVQAARDCGTLVHVDESTFALRDAPPPERAADATAKNEGAEFTAMRESLRQGVQVVAAPQLFPTPRAIAERMVEMAGLVPGMRVLEPSAGTGAIVGAMGGRIWPAGELVAVEINAALCEKLRAQFPLTEVEGADFLSLSAAELGYFDRIIMNPPFINGADIQHITRARTMLKPGGKLIALCANGSRQQEKLQPLADTWEELPADTFKEQGTGVRVVLLTMGAA